MSTYKFSDRHIGPGANDITEMLKVVNASSLNQLIDETIPEKISWKLPVDRSTEELFCKLSIASRFLASPAPSLFDAI